MPAKTAVTLLAFAVSVGPLAAQPAPKPGDDKVLVTKVYNVKPLLGDSGKASGVAVTDVDAVVKLIFDAIPQFHAMKPGTDGSQIVEREGGKLEVRATAEIHGEVKDLLEALERLQDVAVDVKADVIELDTAAYEKLVKALPKSETKPPVLFAIGEGADELVDFKAAEKSLEPANTVLKAGRVVQTASDRFANGTEAALAVRQSVRTCRSLVNDKPAGEAQFVKEGFKLMGLPVVSADRRFVRLKLTEQSVAVTRIKKVDAGEAPGKQRLVLQSFETQDLGATGSAAVADGGTVIFRLAYAPKDKVWVVVLKPTIFIRVEEDARKKP